METCTIPGCNRSVSKPGHKLCYEHWKTENPKTSILSEDIPKPVIRTTSKTILATASTTAVSSLLSATKIAERLGLSRNKVNPLLAELGLIDKVPNGWKPTRLGLSFGAVQKHDEKTDQHYILWSDTILSNQIFVEALCKVDDGAGEEQSSPQNPKKVDFREKFKAGDYRTKDGHWVRSKAELSVDDWLYTENIVHAYERKLPVEEEVYCDFYIPSGKVYVEYWGYEQDPEYSARKQEKQRIYRKYDFNLIELYDEHIKSLDDCLPQMLRSFGIVLG